MNSPHLYSTDDRLVPGTMVLSAGKVLYLIIGVDHDLVRAIAVGESHLVKVTFVRRNYAYNALFVHPQLVLVPT